MSTPQKEFSNDMRFVLFQNTNKEPGSAQPDFRGSFDKDGVTYELSGWSRNSKKDGSPFISGTLRLKEDRPSAAGNPANAATNPPIPASTSFFGGANVTPPATGDAGYGDRIPF